MANERNRVRRVSSGDSARPQNRTSPARPAAPRQQAANPRASVAAGRGTAATGAQKNHRKKKKSGAGLLWALLALAATVVVIAVLVTPNRAAGSSDGGLLDAILPEAKFESGVTVEGVAVGGMTLEEARPLVQEAAAKRLSAAALTLSYEEQTFPLSREQLGLTADVDAALSQALEYKAPSGEDGAAPEPFLAAVSAERGAVVSSLTRIASEFDIPAVEAYAEASTDMEAEEVFTYHAGESGRALDVDATAERILTAIQEQGLHAAVAMTANAIEPTKTLEDVQANTQFIASYTTKFRNSSSDTTTKNRVFNIRKAAGILNGLTLEPDAVWSFNDYVGLRTVAGGWKEANGISGGKEYTLQAGGGICQVSTTLYNALLCGNINIVYRKAHSIPSDYVPLGLDATVDSSGIDFQFSNDTGETLYVFARITTNAKSSRYLDITISLYGKPLPEGVTYKSRSEIIETTPRDDTVYTASASIPMGYQLQTVVKHDGYVAEAYVDKYQDGKLVEGESRLLQQNKYRGNPAEVLVGTGDISLPIPAGASTVGSTVVDETTGIPIYVDTATINSLLAS